MFSCSGGRRGIRVPNRAAVATSCSGWRHARTSGTRSGDALVQIAHYCIRPWPWLISFGAGDVPGIAGSIADSSFDSGVGFPMVMRDLCPPGLRGLMVVTFFAAFMSTISTQMNWGASYLVRDFIQPIFMQGSNDRRLADASRVIGGAPCNRTVVWDRMKYPVLMKDNPLQRTKACRSTMPGRCWPHWGRAPVSCICSGGSGGASMLGARSWRWSRRWPISCCCTIRRFQLHVFGGQVFKPDEEMTMVAGLTIVTWLVATMVTRRSNRRRCGTSTGRFTPGTRLETDCSVE